MNTEHTFTESLRPTPKCPECKTLACASRDERSLAQHGHCADCHCAAIARDNDTGEVPAVLAARGVTSFEFEREVACWQWFHNRTREQAVARAIDVLSQGREPVSPTAPLATVPEIVPPPAELAELHVHADGDAGASDAECIAWIVARGHSAQRAIEILDQTRTNTTEEQLLFRRSVGEQRFSCLCGRRHVHPLHIDRSIPQLERIAEREQDPDAAQAAELLRVMSALRDDCRDCREAHEIALLMDDPEVPALCDARRDEAIAHQEAAAAEWLRNARFPLAM